MRGSWHPHLTAQTINLHMEVLVYANSNLYMKEATSIVSN